ncbi:class I SAM-dependent methyltransferase [Thorsellia anophelis]|uniref:Methyltransferase domain-containing protein n=1 Tax=Thorsellia anophelis DSM 18579 TaxID=1123402 RepID=A0A1I0F4A3_9GAMM|nr:class I SAM-dependent methyltransferase [Thorsellia anophelis]SET52763.1 Methyltransferase domain-containing protein [Thorsellia anophelis DSM 18579]
MTEIELQYLIKLHVDNERQGPGSTSHTLQALALSGFDINQSLQIADIGAGTGSATLPLLSHTASHVTAVDFLEPFLEKLSNRVQDYYPTAIEQGRLNLVNESMDSLTFDANQFDLIWSEGAIYNIGFKSGLHNWIKFLKPKGKMVVSEITWLTHTRPNAIETYWLDNYPEINTADHKIKEIFEAGFTLKGYFELPRECWVNNYYLPIERSLKKLESMVSDTSSESYLELMKLKSREQEEFALYQNYHEYYSYGVYIMQKA